MKFYDRKKEMAILYAAKKQSQTSACFTVMTGRRRIGKTALLLESVKDTRFVYIFVARKSEVLLCAQYQPVIQETLGIRIYGEIREFAQLFELLMQHSQKENFTLIIDEFQEFLYINPSIVSDIQRIWDQYHATSKINFIVCGSVYSIEDIRRIQCKTTSYTGCSAASASIHHHRYQRDSSRPCPPIHIGRFALLVFADRWSSQIHHPIDGSESI